MQISAEIMLQNAFCKAILTCIVRMCKIFYNYRRYSVKLKPRAKYFFLQYKVLKNVFCKTNSAEYDVLDIILKIRFGRIWSVKNILQNYFCSKLYVKAYRKKNFFKICIYSIENILQNMICRKHPAKSSLQY